MNKRFVCLIALIDLLSKRIINRQLSATMEKEFCMEVLEKAFASNTESEIVNPDQGNQFTSGERVESLLSHNVKIDMYGKGRCVDNIFIERFLQVN